MSLFRSKTPTSTRLPTIGVDPGTPEGLAKTFVVGAGEYLKGAQDLDEGFPDQTGAYMLTFHAIELGLKAFLISYGLSENDLQRRYGHDLVGLYDEATKRGLTIKEPGVEDTLAWINKWHDTPIKIRYDFKSERKLPMCSTLFPLVTSIIAATGKTSQQFKGRHWWVRLLRDALLKAVKSLDSISRR